MTTKPNPAQRKLILMTRDRQLLEDRKHDLTQKLREMRRVDGPDYVRSERLWGRVEGQIGELEWILSQN